MISLRLGIQVSDTSSSHVSLLQNLYGALCEGARCNFMWLKYARKGIPAHLKDAHKHLVHLRHHLSVRKSFLHLLYKHWQDHYANTESIIACCCVACALGYPAAVDADSDLPI